MSVTTHAALAAHLLRNNAVFFRKLAEDNPSLDRQMQENAKVFESLAGRLESDPTERLPQATRAPDADRSFDASGQTHAAAAARLLRDSAAFYRSLSGQNPAMERQLEENAGLVEQVAELLELDPTGSIERED